MKTVHLGKRENAFQYKTIKELRTEAKKYNITIGYNVSIGDDVSIGYNASIGDDVSIGCGVSIGYAVSIGCCLSIGYNVTIENNVSILVRAKIPANIKIDKIYHLMNLYMYNVSGYSYNGIYYVQMGCFTRTIEEWDSDFWNNDIEFPKYSKAGQERWNAYQKMKKILEIDTEV